MKKNQQNELRSLLRKTGMKITPGHLSILSFVRSSKKPISIQDVIDGINEKLDPATVYRCINKFKGSGLVRQIDLRQNNAYYEFFDMAHHHHIICTRCGRIEDIENCNIEALYSALIKKTKHFDSVKQHSLEFYGLCKKCSN